MCHNPDPNPNPSPNLEERDHVHAEDLLAHVVVRLDHEGDEAAVLEPHREHPAGGP